MTFPRTFGNLSSPVRLAYLDDNFTALETGSTSTVSLAGAALVGFIQPGGVSRTVQARLQDQRSVKDFGAVGDGVTDDTAAIDLALASGLDIFFPPGTYMTTGGHVQLTIGQRVVGAGHMFPSLGGTGTTLKKISGTSALWAINGHNGSLQDMMLDGISLGGNLLQVNTKYLYLRNLTLTGQGGTDFAMMFNSVNSSLFDNLFFPDGNYGNIATTGASAMLYCTFNSVSMGTVTGPYAIDIANAISNTFNGIVFENPLRIGVTCENLKFNGLSVETAITNTKLIEITQSTAVNITFNGFRVLSNGLRTVALIDIVNAQGVHFENVSLQDLVSAAPIFFALDTTKDFVCRNATVYSLNAFDFVKCNTTGLNTNVTIDNCNEINSSAGGTCQWLTWGLEVHNSGFTQVFFANTAKRVHMSNVYGPINTDNIAAAALVSLSSCDFVTDATGIAVLQDCTLTTGARITNGRTKTTLHTILSGAANTLTAFVSAGIIIKGVTSYVPETITSAGAITGFDIGHNLAAPGADQNAWGDNIAVTAGTTTGMTAFTISSAIYYTTNSLGDLILTSRGANFNGTAGKVRLTMIYETLGSPTS